MSVPSSTTFGDNVPWEKLAADAKLAVASALDSHFAASIPQLDRATTPFGSHVQVTDNVRQLLSEPQTTALPRHLSSAEFNPRSRRASADARDTITYTPATHRISKAKKGKRVHACQFPGCPKVFTRAEHRRRHELNHNPQASFVCEVEGCGKGFHRSDLLARHVEKHDSDVRASPKPSPQKAQRQRSSTASSTVSEPVGTTVTSPPPQSFTPQQPISPPPAVPANSHVPGTQPQYQPPVGAQDLVLRSNAGPGAGEQERIVESVVENCYPYLDDIPPYLSPDRGVTPLSDATYAPMTSQLPAAGRTPEPHSGGSSVSGSPPPPFNLTFADFQGMEPIMQPSPHYPINFDHEDMHAMYQLQFPQTEWTDMSGVTSGAKYQPVPEVFPAMTEWQ